MFRTFSFCAVSNLIHTVEYMKKKKKQFAEWLWTPDAEVVIILQVQG